MEHELLVTSVYNSIFKRVIVPTNRELITRDHHGDTLMFAVTKQRPTNLFHEQHKTNTFPTRRDQAVVLNQPPLDLTNNSIGVVYS